MSASSAWWWSRPGTGFNGPDGPSFADANVPSSVACGDSFPQGKPGVLDAAPSRSTCPRPPSFVPGRRIQWGEPPQRFLPWPGGGLYTRPPLRGGSPRAECPRDLSEGPLVRLWFLSSNNERNSRPRARNTPRPAPVPPQRLASPPGKVAPASHGSRRRMRADYCRGRVLWACGPSFSAQMVPHQALRASFSPGEARGYESLPVPFIRPPSPLRRLRRSAYPR